MDPTEIPTFCMSAFIYAACLSDITLISVQWDNNMLCITDSDMVLKNVSVLGQEEGYTVKYTLSMREIQRDFQRAQAILHRISRLE